MSINNQFWISEERGKKIPRKFKRKLDDRALDWRLWGQHVVYPHRGNRLAEKMFSFWKPEQFFLFFRVFFFAFFFALKWHSIHETVTQRQTAVVARPRIVVKIGPGLRRRLIASRIQKIAFGWTADSHWKVTYGTLKSVSGLECQEWGLKNAKQNKLMIGRWKTEGEAESFGGSFFFDNFKKDYIK